MEDRVKRGMGWQSGVGRGGSEGGQGVRMEMGRGHLW